MILTQSPLRIVTRCCRPFQILLICILQSVRLANAVDLPVEEKSDAIAIKGTVNGRAVTFLLDTGAYRSAVDERILTDLGVTPLRSERVLLPLDSVKLKVFNKVNFRIDECPVVSVNPFGIDLNVLNQTSISDFEAILGLDAMKSLSVLFDDGKVSVHRFQPDGFDNLPFVSMHSGNSIRPRVDLEISGHGVHPFLIDTGMNSPLRLTEEIRKKLELEGDCVRTRRERTATVKGHFFEQGYVVREFVVGGVVFQNIPVAVGRNNAVGMDILRHLKLLLHFPKGRVYTGKASVGVVEKFPVNASGMALKFTSPTKLVVYGVRPDSTAEDFGILVDDEALVLDGKNPSDLSLYDVQEILAQNGKTISVTFRRGAEDRTANLPLKLPFEYPPKWADIKANAEDFEQFLKDSEAQPGKKSK